MFSVSYLILSSNLSYVVLTGSTIGLEIVQYISFLESSQPHFVLVLGDLQPRCSCNNNLCLTPRVADYKLKFNNVN